MKSMKFVPQVPKEHYFKNYDTKERWMSYWYQINEILKLNPENVLEIGVGNKVVSDYLRKQGIKVTTVDIDPELKPDFVCSVTNLSEVLKSKYDVVLCAQVLEHLPFSEFEKSLNEIKKVCKRYAIITLPYGGIDLSLIVYFPKKGLKKILSVKIPFPRKHKFDGEHYWEIGKKGYSLSKIRKILSKYFIVEKEFYPPENMWHYFLILSVKK